MRLLEKSTTIPHRSGTHPFFALGDVHIGHINTHYERFIKDIKEIKETPEAGVFLMGDILDSIITSDPRFAWDTVDHRFRNVKAMKNLPMAQAEYAISKLDPIRDQIVMFLSGNHEANTRKRSGQKGLEFDPALFICKELGVEDVYVDYCGHLSWRFEATDCPKRGADVVSILCHHGHGGGRLKGGKLNNLDKGMNSVEADALFCGHTHELMASRKVRNRIIKKKGVLKHEAHDMLMSITGTYLMTYKSSTDYKQSEYGEVAFYEPTSIGMVRGIIYPRKHLVRVFI